jgi:hypothetical protein
VLVELLFELRAIVANPVSQIDIGHGGFEDEGQILAVTKSALLDRAEMGEIDRASARRTDTLLDQGLHGFS